ncbi:hypothetical protein BC629DRAFT_1502248 [Irpex lacteus]|nr:hypothetical protein BC629DRAFT_1502248 [Irpex lacteus]
MPGLHLATSVTLLSSIPGPTAMPHAKREQYIPVPSKEYMPRTDSLNGSLGLFLVMCGLILLFVMAVAVFFWRVHVHRRTRRAIAAPDVEEVRRDIAIPTLLYNTDSNASHASVKLPPSLRVRSPIKNKLKSFKLKATKGNVAEAAHGPSVLGQRRSTISKVSPKPSVPSIVVSECSPVIPTSDVFAPTNSTTMATHSRSSSASSMSSVSSTGSTGSLRVPGSYKPQATVLVTLDSASSLGSNSRTKRFSTSDRKVKFKSPSRSKGSARSSSRGGKENAVPPGLKGGIYDMTQLDGKGKPVRLAPKTVMASHTFV